jgi:DNA segregation ATPase FtsK/SpoIIIE, S-DNA-T family
LIFEIVSSTVLGGLAIQAHLSKNGVGNDSKKLNMIFSLSGLNVKDGKQTLTTQLLKKRNYEWGTEYRYRIPLGRSFEDYVSKKETIEAGINTRKVKIQLNDLKELKLDRKLIQNIKGLYTKKLTHRKEIELSYDGVLVVRVYDNPLPIKVSYEAYKDWKVNLGITREKNASAFIDFEKTPHFTLGGATRYGKSNLINCVINSLLEQQPENVKLYLIDLKGGIELGDYENLKQTVSVAYEPEEALDTLSKAYEAMRKMQQRLKKIGKKKIQDSGIKERHFVIIDEVGELNPDEAVDTKDTKDKDGNFIYKSEKTIKVECQKIMSQIARLGAGLGFRQILATQYPTGDVIPRQCKQNSDAKLCFRVQSVVASRVVLDSDGAEKLPQIVGRAILQTADKRIIVQTPLIDEDTIRRNILPHLKKEVSNFETKPKTRTNIIEFEETGLS